MCKTFLRRASTSRLPVAFILRVPCRSRRVVDATIVALEIFGTPWDVEMLAVAEKP